MRILAAIRAALVVSLLALPLAAPSAAGDAVVRHVPGDYPTIQAALDASSSGDIVLVAPGTYFENLVLDAQHDGVRLLSAGGPAVTVIDGGQLTSVVRCTALGPQTRIEGFTITHGRAQPGSADNLGGAFRLDEAHLVIENNVIRDNFAEAAGALYIDASRPSLIGNVIMDNEALASGGAIYCDHFAHARIEGNVIIGNLSGHYGGGVTIWEHSEPLLIGNTIAFNEAALGGGGVYITRSSRPELLRNIIAGSPVGGGIALAVPSAANLACNDVWNNQPSNYMGLPDETGIDGNISADPEFCAPGALDLHLSESSPCAPDGSPPGCGLIGAREVGCGPVAAESSTWGGIKSHYR